MSNYTLESTPPVRREVNQKRSRWAELFAEAREHPGSWRRIIEPMRRSTAAQVASGIRLG